MFTHIYKTNVIKFISKKSKEEHIHFRYSNIIKETDSLKFLGLELDNCLNWKKQLIGLCIILIFE